MQVYCVISGYILCMSIIGFFSMGIDKYKARRGLWRIPEKTLFIIAIIGGSIGSILGMRFFRHKTKHKSFVVGMPLILIFQCVFVIICYIFYGQFYRNLI